MKTSETQPLEETTPVVPETAATAAPEDDRPQSRTTAAGRDDDAPTDDAPTDDAPSDDEPSEDHYPPAPAGSAGHP
jgi:hypothetical protein